MKMETETYKVLPLMSRISVVLREIGLFLICLCSIFLASQCKVPFYPVPFTLQTMIVVLMSLFAGRNRALVSLAAFTAIWHPAILTAGYRLAFLLVPVLIGDNARRLLPLNLLSRIFLAHLVILIFGAAVLSCFIGFKGALFSGLLFFVPAELLKGIFSFTLVRLYGMRKG